MPFPAYWPAANKFDSLDNILQTATLNSGHGSSPLSALQGINRLLQNYAAQNNYTVAPLDKTSQMYQDIDGQVTNTWQHEAGYWHDKYAPTRLFKGTPAGPGQTKIKSFQEGIPLLNLKRLKVNPNEWSAVFILVCKNQARWGAFEQCRANFDGSGVDATNDFQNLQWTTQTSANFPLIDPKRGECWLWSGQSLDILHGVMTHGFQGIHCQSTGTTGYGALGRGNYFTDKFSKALLYAINLRNEYFGEAKGLDFRVLMLSRVLLGNYLSIDGATKQEKDAQRMAHNIELTGSAQRQKRQLKLAQNPTPPGVDQYDHTVKLYRDAKLTRQPMQKGWKANYQITGTNRDANIGHESVHMTHKQSNEFLVAIGKQVYPEFLVFVYKG